MPRLGPSKRREIVEATIRECGWTEAIVRDLMAQCGVSRRTIYNDRDAVIDRLTNEEQATREQRRTGFLLDLERDIEAARGAGKWASVSSMMNLRSRITGLDVPPPEPEPDEPGNQIANEDPLAAHWKEVSKLRKDAQSRGSMVAAARLLEQEAAALAAIREAERQRREAEAQTATDDQVVAQFTQALQALPDAVVDELARAITARRGT